MCCFKGHDDVVAGTRDRAAAGVVGAVLKGELNNAFGAGSAGTVSHGLDTVSIVVTRAEPNGQDIAILLKAHLKRCLAA